MNSFEEDVIIRQHFYVCIMSNIEFGKENSSETRRSLLSVGSTLHHKASHNRYQLYEIKKIEWDSEAMMGAGCFIYTVDFYEWDNISRNNPADMRFDWRIAEIVLPIRNQINWES